MAIIDYLSSTFGVFTRVI